MKVTVERKSFMKTLVVGSQFADKKNIMPILCGIKIEVMSNGYLYVTSSNNDYTISKKVQVSRESDEHFGFCIDDYKALLKYVSAINDDNVDVCYEDNVLNIEHENGKVSFGVMSTNEWPTPCDSEYTSSIKIDSKELYDMISKATPFTAKAGNIRPIIECINVVKESGKLSCYASDGQKMFAEFKKVDESIEGDNGTSICFKKNTIDTIKDMRGVITVSMNDKNMKITSSDSRLIVSAQEGVFPNMSKVLPKSYAHTLVMSRKELLTAVERASVSCDETTGLIKLTFTNGSVGIESESLTSVKSSSEKVVCDCDFDFVLGLKYANTCVCLNALSSEYISMNMNENNRPVIIKEVDADDRLVMIMPMAL